MIVVLAIALLLSLPQNGQPHCAYGRKPVCGSDGFTYFNRCDFEVVKAIHRNLTIVHYGACTHQKANQKHMFSV
ncbi:unnamed protein product [Leptidea sinapis]|uniref:Kazal-like domain-containing protein n=1 Tax=Leptidea sinapis TaxID=189913 RepID=A0A5E4QZ48_9NEOP|nr:unnamed protein product [Leptidea sinapis]